MDNQKQSIKGKPYEIGQINGDLKLISKIENKDQWNVECLKCGNIHEISTTSLSRVRNNKQEGCKNCRKRKKFFKNNHPGDIIACFELIDVDGGNYWEVKCIKCGKIQKQSIPNMKKRKSDHCIYCENPEFVPNYQGGGAIIKRTLDERHFLNYKHKIELNNSIETKKFKIWELNLDDFSNLIHSNCHYCGSEPSDDNQWNKSGKRKTLDEIYYINGIDRFDSNKGYTNENCFPCCKKCNIMKHDFKHEDFIKHINQIFTYNKCSETIPEGSTLQAYGNGNGKPLTHNGEGEDIVQSV